MKYEEIQELLDRYWEGETTLEEERKLKAYFNAGTIDERLLPVAPMFQAFREEQTVQLTSKAKTVQMRPQMYHWAVAASIALLLAAGWWLFRTEKVTAPMAAQKTNELPERIEKPAPETPEKAMALEAKTIPDPVVPQKKTPPKRIRPKPAIDPETARAMAEIKAALALVSAKLDKGRNEAVKGATYLDAMEKVPKKKAG